MKSDGRDSELARSDGSISAPAFQVIVLGSGGGPNEDNVTGLLVRSTATKWAKGSILAVDAGTHLSAITRTLQEHYSSQVPAPGEPSSSTSKGAGAARLGNGASSRPPSRSPRPPTRRKTLEGNGTSPMSTASARSTKHVLSLSTGPFAGLELPHESAAANAAYITRELVSTYLITHPHLDHISGFVVNTASFQHTSRPKRLAALPSTIDAIKTHIFNDLIWPNLSDEEGGVGLVSYMRLAEGGNIAIGEGDGRGYIEVCDGLGVKSWSVSHGHCTKKHNHARNSVGWGYEMGNQSGGGSRRVSTPSTDPAEQSHRRSMSLYGSGGGPEPRNCVYDSTAYFIRDEHTGKEVLIFGDVEPDSISLTPRTAQVWTDAATKIAAGLLTGVFIECSYDDSQSDETLFGHLAPRHLMDELRFLAAAVVLAREKLLADDSALLSDDSTKSPSGNPRKRKRASNGLATITATTNIPVHPPDRAAAAAVPRRASRPAHTPRTASVSSVASRSRRGRSRSTNTILPLQHEEPPADENLPPTPNPRLGSGVLVDDQKVKESRPLAGLRVVIIHMKDTLRDGPPIGVPILRQLEEYEAEAGLGCKFIISKAGGEVWL